MPIGFSQPLYLLLLILAVPVAWSAVHYLRPLSSGRRRAAITVRLLAMLLVIFALAGAQAVRQHHDLSVVAVVDESESMLRFAPRESLDPNELQKPASLQEWSRTWLRLAAADRKVDDRLGLVTYDARPTVVAMPSPTQSIDTGIVPQPRQGSQGGAAIRLAMAMLPPDTARRLVLVSDGNDTSEVDLLAAARQAAGAGVPIDVLPVNYTLHREVMVEGLYAPAQARQGQTAAIRVVLRATQPASGQLYLLRNGEPIDLNGSDPGPGAPINAAQWIAARSSGDAADDASSKSTTASQENYTAQVGRYTLVKLIDLPLSESGANRFEAVFEPDEGADAVLTNNRASAFTLVRGQGKVLILSHEPKEETQRLVTALQEHGIETRVGQGNAMPVDLAELSRYDTVILENIPAEQMDESQQTLLSQYVSDTGGGLVVLGGPDSFGAGGWNNSPLSKIFPVDCELPAKLVLPTGALMIVIDRSGSMNAPVQGGMNQQKVAAEAAVLAIATLYPRDLVGVVSFDSDARLDVPLGFNTNRRQVMDKVRSIVPEGGTNIYSGLEAAYHQLADVDVDEAAIKHIILLTDGQSGEGDYPDILRRMKQRHITLSTIGVGNGVDGNLLLMLAKQGGGKYYPVINPRQLPQVFIKEARTIRKNLIREIPFMPKLVLSGSPVIAGLTSTPPLEGFVRTAPRADPRVFLAMVGPDDEPILAHWQVGLGQVAAFTSDATSRWGKRWVDWPGYGDFWSRMVRAIGRPGSSRDLEMTTRFVNDELVLTIDAAHAGGNVNRATGSGSFSQLSSVQAAVVGPDGQRQMVTLNQTGPGQYETKVPAATSGSYLVSVLGEDGKGNRQFVAGGANRPPGLELRRFSSNRTLLEEVAHLTGGRVLVAEAGQVTGLFSRDGKIEVSRSIRPLWRLLMWLLLPLFLLDVAVRRLSWDPSAIRAWLGLRDGGRTRAGDAQATLTALRKNAQRGDAQQATQSQQTTQAMPPQVKKPSQSKQQPASDQTVRPATAAPVASATTAKPVTPAPAVKPDKPEEGDKPAEPATGTSRLMDAKRRARQKLDES